jgi:polyisoprenoid-binding protein YceI
MQSQTPELPLAPGRWLVDAAHSSVGFTIRHLGVAKVRGRFARFTADVIVGATLQATSVTATVDLASVDTGNPARDADIAGPSLIDVTRRPDMTFRTLTIHGEGAGWALDGELGIGDITGPLSLTVTFGGIQEVPGGGPRHAGFEARGLLRRSDFSIAPGFPAAVLGEIVTVELDLELLEP